MIDLTTTWRSSEKTSAKAGSTTKTTDSGNKLFTAPEVDAAWKKGIHTIGSLSFDSISYCASYIQKRQNGEAQEDHYRRVNPETGEVYDQEPEFGTMSRGGRTGKGIGHSWIEKYHTEVYPSDSVLVNGKLAMPPDYYDRWYAKHHPQAWEKVQTARIAKAKTRAWDNSKERLAVRKKVFQARHKQNRRKDI